MTINDDDDCFVHIRLDKAIKWWGWILIDNGDQYVDHDANDDDDGDVGDDANDDDPPV